MGVERKLPKYVNRLSNQQDIAEAFAVYFSAACSNNSDSRSTALYNEYRNRVHLLGHSDRCHEAILSVELVANCISKLKCGKAAGVDRLTAEHLINAHPIVVQLLTKLMNLMILFEYVPDSFGLGVMVPIPKAHEGSSNVCTDEFRGISLNVIISKLFEHCLLSTFSGFLESSDFQFGFKSKSSCSKALYSVRKTVEFFIERQSTVNLCALDLAKAFDKMNRHALFIKLLNRNCPITLINILDCWFSKTLVCVKWGDAISSYVTLQCGVRQGGILSPALFSVFINDVIVRLHKSSLGCHIRNLCLNTFMYADDLLLLSITIHDLQSMLNICKTEFDWLDMSVNIKKSACIRIGNRLKSTAKEVQLGDKFIKWCKEICYLGIVITSASAFRCNFHTSKVKFFRSLNGILGRLGSQPQIALTLSLTSSFCHPILFYGLEALCLSKADISLLSYPYNSVFTKLFSSFDKTVLTLCQFYSGHLPFNYIVDLRTLQFYVGLSALSHAPANVLYKWFGEVERAVIATKYDVTILDSPCLFKYKLHTSFENYVNTLL